MQKGICTLSGFGLAGHVPGARPNVWWPGHIPDAVSNVEMISCGLITCKVKSGDSNMLVQTKYLTFEYIHLRETHGILLTWVMSEETRVLDQKQDSNSEPFSSQSVTHALLFHPTPKSNIFPYKKISVQSQQWALMSNWRANNGSDLRSALNYYFFLLILANLPL